MNLKKLITEELRLLKEGTINPEDIKIKDEFEWSLKRNFNDVSYSRKDDKYYDYGPGYVHINNEYIIRDWEWAGKYKDIFINCQLRPPSIYAFFTYSEIISDATPRKPEAKIYFNNGTNYQKAFVTNNFKPNKFIQDFIKKSQNKNMVSEISKSLFSPGSWKPLTSSSKVLNKRDQGHGIWASVKVEKAYEKAYSINGLDKIFGSPKNFEKFIAKQYSFKKDKLAFDWSAGVMIVNGTWTDTYD